MKISRVVIFYDNKEPISHFLSNSAVQITRTYKPTHNRHGKNRATTVHVLGTGEKGCSTAGSMP
jgi:hypothetical protein